MSKTCITDEHLLFNELGRVFDAKYLKKREDLTSLTALAPVFSTEGIVPSLNKKDTRVKVWWDASCGLTVTSCDDSCTPSGLTTDDIDCQEYNLTECEQVNFAISHEKFEGLENALAFNTELANKLLQADYSLSKAIQSYMLTTIDATAGLNAFTQDPSMTVTATETSIPANKWNANLLGYFGQAKKFNKYDNAVILSGNYALQQDIYNNSIGLAGNDATKSAYEQFGIEFDVYNISTELSNNDTYMLDASRMKLATVNHNASSTPTIAYPDGQVWSKWSMASKYMPNVTFDVFEKVSCVSDEYAKHDYRVKVNYGMVQAPADVCDGTVHALKFTCA